MEVAACSICVSPHRAEIEKKDIPGKSAEVISWARKQGVNISKFSLAKHRANHMPGVSDDSADTAAKASPKRSAIRMAKSDKSQAIETKSISAPVEIRPEKQSAGNITDTLFLETVRDMVYQKLLSGEMELKLESGFKAIEIKNKISEESQSEKLLLEILNEIRAEELSK